MPRDPLLQFRPPVPPEAMRRGNLLAAHGVAGPAGQALDVLRLALEVGLVALEDATGDAWRPPPVVELCRRAGAKVGTPEDPQAAPPPAGTRLHGRAFEDGPYVLRPGLRRIPSDAPPALRELVADAQANGGKAGLLDVSPEIDVPVIRRICEQPSPDHPLVTCLRPRLHGGQHQGTEAGGGSVGWADPIADLPAPKPNPRAKCRRSGCGKSRAQHDRGVASITSPGDVIEGCPGFVEATPKPPAPKGETPVQVGWRTWRAAYLAHYRRPYSETTGDGPAMIRLAKLAVEMVEALDMADVITDGKPALELLFVHRWRRYLADPGMIKVAGDTPFLRAQAHGLRWHEIGIPKYGTPWDRASSKSTAEPGIAPPAPAGRARYVKRPGT